MEAGGRGRLQGNCWFSPHCQYDVTSCFGDIQNGGKSRVDEADKIVEFLMDMLNNVIRFGDNKIPIVIEIQNLVPLLDETFRSMINFYDSFLSSSKSAEQSYQPVRLSRASAQQVGGV